ncbi:MAG: protein kinase [Acidobacteria bacterium]|nr:protein kinase [Acidobacteriota bacterium]
MTPERWRQADELVLAALARPAEARAMFLTDACADDAELEQEVASLLQYHQRLDGFLSQPPLGAMAEAVVSGQMERAGQTLGRYQITCALARGGMGEVYLARDIELGRRVALKLLPEKFTQDPDRVNRFRQEARAASALNHPNILTIYEIGVVEGVHFIASEFVEGQTVRALIHDRELKLGTALDLAIQTAGALAAAHQAGIVHRDIKPENLMRRPDGFVKVLDFGLAKLNERLPVTNSPVAGFPTIETQSGIVLGTVSYMSPEQARGLEVDARSDLFSLGVVLYEMIAGCQPFNGATTSDVLAALLTAEPPALARFVPAVPTELQRIVSRALAKERDERYQTASALNDDLKQLKDELSLRAQLRRKTDSNEQATLELPLGAAPQPTAQPQTGQPTRTNAVGVAHRASELRAGFFHQFNNPRRLAWLALAVLLTMVAALGFRQFFHSAHQAAPINTLAVLPFTNALNDPQMDYLTDGITEGIIDNLSLVAPLQVLARGTVYSYRDRNKERELDPRQAGETLHVGVVVLGRVQRQGEHLLIRAELVDTSNGALLWSEQYPRSQADLLAVQGEITREISNKLRLRLSGEQQRQLAQRHTSDSEAYQLYLLGHHFYLRGGRANLERARDYYNQAIARDSGYALAYAGIADFYATASAQFYAPDEAMPKAREAAHTAVRLDDLLPEAHYALASVLNSDWEWAGAEREFRRAIELNPNYVLAYSRYASHLSVRGRFDEALRAARRAQELDPLELRAGLALGFAFFFGHRLDEAAAQYRQALDLSGSNAARVYLGRVFAAQGKSAEALAEFRQAATLDQQPSYRAWLAYGYALNGQRAEALTLLRDLEMQSQHERISPAYLARIYLGLGDKKRALDWLQKSYDEHSDHVLNLGHDPVYDPLRDEPRFQALLRGIGLAP